MADIALTERQVEAVETLGKDICVVAGPGAGKTMVLIERFFRVVAAGISPLRILAITFTEKAANQLKQRLIKRYGNDAWLRPQIERAYISTVHGFCARLLRENAIAAGLDPEFRVLDERESGLVEREAVVDALDALFHEKPQAVRSLLAHLASPDLGFSLTAVYAAMRAAGVGVSELGGFVQPAGMPFPALVEAVKELCANPVAARTPKQQEAAAALAEWCGCVLELRDAPLSPAHFETLARFRAGRLADPRLKRIRDELVPAITETLITRHYAADREVLLDALARFESLYRLRKRQLGGLDYADLEEHAVALLETEAGVREAVRGQFEQVLMDELQDTNRQQARLVNLLRRPDHFYAVGDINQSIYGFRNADPEVFREYRDEVRSAGRPVIELRENFRSRPEILRAALTVLQGAAGIEQHRLIAGKEFPDKGEPSVEILVACGADAEQALDLEARMVARRVRELEGSLRLKDRVAGFKDFAVLVRNSNILPAFEKAFEGERIPYRVDRGRGFFEAREVVDLIALLRTIANPRDEIATAAVLHSPLVGISDETLMRMKAFGNLGTVLKRPHQFDLSGFDAADRERLLRFSAGLVRWRNDRLDVPADRLVVRAMAGAGYRETMEPRARANVEKLLALLRQLASRGPLDSIVSELDLLRQAAGEADAAVEDTGCSVQVMTVHSAKGLEFPVVFLAGLNKGVDHGSSPIGFSPRFGLGARWRNPANGSHVSDSACAKIREERQAKESGESERLFYVAMTRAEEHLVLSFSAVGNSHPEWAGYLERGLGLDLRVVENGERIEGVFAPDGSPFDVRIRTADALPEPEPEPAPERAEEEAAAAPAIAITGQHDSTASVTSISQFARCPRRYYLARYLGWSGARPARITDEVEPPPEADELDASEFGNQVHAILAGTHTGPAVPEAEKLAGRFHASALGRRVRAATRVEREFDFFFAVEDVVLRGQIDLWFEQSGRIALVDYKTDAVDVASAVAHAGEYSLQLQLYAMALERLTGRTPDEAYVYLLRPDVAVPVPLQPLFLHTAAAAVRDFREAQDRLDFPLHTSPGCRQCPFFRRQCPAELPA